MAKQPRGYIAGLDGLRAYAIFLVILTHLGLYSWLPASPFWQTRFWRLCSGATGVGLFFTLSGFLITHLLLLEKRDHGTVYFKNFVIRRLLRLMPPLLVFYFVIGILISVGLLANEKVGLVISVLYLYNFVPKRFYMLELGHTWSLGVEEQFYLLWPLVIKHFERLVSIVVAIIAITCCAAAIASPPMFSFTFWGIRWTSDSFFCDRFFIPAVGPIMVGAATSLIYFSGGPRTTRRIGNALLWIGGAGLFLAPLYVPRIFLPYSMLIQSVGVGLILIWITENQFSGIVRVLEWKPFCFTGKMSDGIYIWQGLFLRTGPGGGSGCKDFLRTCS